MSFPRFLSLFALAALALTLTACGTPRTTTSSGSSGGYYKVGNPYQIKGQWYYPREDYSYDETGIASWYGADFHDQATANGEIYNKDELTAAHKTLPLPSLARVTNLENGKSIVVRVNDRGPFSGARIIDVSQRCAQLLGFEQQGTAKVRVQVLADESKAIADAMRHYGSTQVASAPGTPVRVETASLPPSDVRAETLEPVRTTPETHEQLLNTRPLPVVVQVPVTGENRLYIQAGAFTVFSNAERLKRTLSSLGPTTISDVVVNGTTFHRVRVGPISSVAKADALLERVKRAGASGARTIVD